MYKILLFNNSLISFSIQTFITYILYIKLQNELITTALFFFLWYFFYGMGIARSKVINNTSADLVVNADDEMFSNRVIKNLFFSINLYALLIFSINFFFLFLSLELKRWGVSKELILLIQLNSGVFLVSALAFLMGRDFGYMSQVSDSEKFIGLKIAMTYFGSIVAILVFAWLLKKNITKYFNVFIFVIFCMSFLYLNYRLKFKMYKKIGYILFLTIPIFNLFITVKNDHFQNVFSKIEMSQINLKNYFKNIVQYKSLQTRFQKIELIINNMGRDSDLYLDGSFQLNTEFENLYHDSFLLFPLKILSKPQSVLILGGGDGYLLKKILNKYPDINVHMVELDAELFIFSKQQFHNKEFQSNNPNVKFNFQDAFKFIIQDQQKYDLIFADFPDPHSLAIAKLYSVEFYQNIKKRLNPEGILAFDYPCTRKPENLLTTLEKTGFKQALMWGVGHCFFLVGNSDSSEFLSQKYGLNKLESQNVTIFNLKDYRRGIYNTVMRPSIIYF